MSDDNRQMSEPPLNPLPPVVWALALPMIVIECILQLADRGILGGAQGIGWRMSVLSKMVFLPDQLIQMWEMRYFAPQEAARILAYAFVHLSFTHAAFVVVFVLALGKFVGEVFRPVALAILFLGSTVGAALIYTLALALIPELQTDTGLMLPLAGGYPGAFGLIGAFTFVLWLRIGAQGGPSWRAFSLIGMMMGIRLVFGLLFGAGPDWVADLAGFGVGFLLSFLLVPGGPARLLAHIRER